MNECGAARKGADTDHYPKSRVMDWRSKELEIHTRRVSLVWQWEWDTHWSIRIEVHLPPANRDRKMASIGVSQRVSHTN